MTLGLDFNFTLDLSNKTIVRQIKRTKIQISVNIPGYFLYLREHCFERLNNWLLDISY